MQPLLTIGIPTFERADLLDAQLRWLHGALETVTVPVEVLVTDNASGDHTQAVIERWRQQFVVPFRSHRQTSNVGPIRNIAFCMEEARGEYVWVVSDDDQLRPDTMDYVLDNITSRPNLALIVLNHGARHVASGRIRYERCYHRSEDAFSTDGKKLFGDCLLRHQGGVTLTTALVYRTDLVRASMAAWPEGLDNYSVQTYMTAFCASRGAVLVSSEPHVTCALGDHWFVVDDVTRNRFRYEDKPAMYVKLGELGYQSVLRKKAARSTARSLVTSLKDPSELVSTSKKMASLAGSKLRRPARI